MTSKREWTAGPEELRSQELARAFLAGVEFGFILGERGHNLDYTLAEAQRAALARADGRESVAARTVWRSPETGAALVDFRPLNALPGPPSPPRMVDPTNGQLWAFQMGSLTKLAGRATQAEMAAALQSKGES